MKRALALLVLLCLGLACRAAPPPSPTPTRDLRLASARQALRQGDSLKALSLLEAFLREQPETVEARVLLGEAYAQAGRLDEAEAAYREALRRAPADRSARLGLSMALYRSGRLSEAAAELQAILAQDPREARASYLLGAVQLQQGRLEEATQAFEAALRWQGNFPEAYVGRGAARFLRGDLAGAEADLRRALALAPEMPEAHYWLGRLLAQLGQVEEAQQHLRAFLERPAPSPFREEAEALLQMLQGPPPPAEGGSSSTGDGRADQRGQGLDQKRIVVEGAGASEIQPSLRRCLPGLHVQVVEDLQVVRHKADGADHHALRLPLAGDVLQDLQKIRPQPWLAGGAGALVGEAPAFHPGRASSPSG